MPGILRLPRHGGRSLVAGSAGTLEVVITADMRQRYVAIDVPLPAGSCGGTSGGRFVRVVSP